MGGERKGPAGAEPEAAVGPARGAGSDAIPADAIPGPMPGKDQGRTRDRVSEAAPQVSLNATAPCMEPRRLEKRDKA
jgi:hypothetical protein